MSSASSGERVCSKRRKWNTPRSTHASPLPAIAGAVGFIAVTRMGSTGPLVAALSLTAFGVLGWLGPFWALPTAFLKEQAAAGGIALINSMGAVGGFVGPYLIGYVKQRTGSFTPGLLLLAASLVAGVAIVLGLRRAGSAMGAEPVERA